MLQLAVVVVTVAVCGIAATTIANRLVRDSASDRARSLAVTLALDAEISDALGDADPTARLQPMVEAIRHQTGVSFIVVMTPEGTRITHPSPSEIGRPYIGTIAPAQQGRTFAETYTGTLGPSVRTITPVRDAATGEIVGLISVGIVLDDIYAAFRRELPFVLGAVALALVLAVLGSWLVARRLRRQTFGMGPTQLARVYEHHDAVLHSVREGLFVIDPDGRLVVANDEARRLAGLDDEDRGRPLDELDLADDLARLLRSGPGADDQVALLGERLVVVNQARAEAEGRLLGTVVTLRDLSEVAALREELGAVQTLSESLRATMHEASNRMQVVVTLIEMGDVDAAVRFATAGSADAQRLADELTELVGEPALAALLLGKTAEARERGVELTVSDETTVPPGVWDPDDLATVVGNLVDNAIDAAATGDRPGRVEVTIVVDGDDLVAEVRDTGPGLPPEVVERMFDPGWSTKPDDPARAHGRGLGLALVRRVADRLGGDVRATEADGAVVTVRLPRRQEARA